MASDNFCELFYSGLMIRAERDLSTLLNWIKRNRSLLEVGIYYIQRYGITLTYLYRSDNGSVFLINECC